MLSMKIGASTKTQAHTLNLDKCPASNLKAVTQTQKVTTCCWWSGNDDDDDDDDADDDDDNDDDSDDGDDGDDTDGDANDDDDTDITMMLRMMAMMMMMVMIRMVCIWRDLDIRLHRLARRPWVARVLSTMTQLCIDLAADR